MMGTSVLKGGFTTFLGTVVLGASSSSAFRTFFVMLVSTVLLGMVHGLVALPVFLATAYNVAGGEEHLEHHDVKLGSDKVNTAAVPPVPYSMKSPKPTTSTIEEEDDVDRAESESSIPPPPGERPEKPPVLMATPDKPQDVQVAVDNDVSFMRQALSFRGMGENPMKKKGGKAVRKSLPAANQEVELKKNPVNSVGATILEQNYRMQHAKGEPGVRGKGKKGQARSSHYV
ncbi:hypothetical protein TeGR_g2768 [Tetraparma gracilis]|uniref:Patched n=1 Tax=Tetraparma gracilis TaxID=2962635 RepID=A0ABQ6N9P0_9STRA|nr:hypothetical protein TeGR_g2768 [Tetraparma gracilis]